MTDLQKSKWLRGAMIAILWPSTLALVTFADIFLSAASKHLFGSGLTAPIEIGFFAAIVFDRLWSWLSRRVWVGSVSRDAGAS